MTARRVETVDLLISGMSCGACVSRVEKSLNRISGVSAAANFATGLANVQYDATTTSLADLTAAVESAGYRARVPSMESIQHAEPDTSDIARRVRMATVLSLPVGALSLIPKLRFDGSQWLQMAASIPVVLWAGAPIHRRALQALRHRGTTMDSLVSLSTLTALSAGIGNVLVGNPAQAYFDVATGVIASQLSGKLLEERARGASGQAIDALLSRATAEAHLLDSEGHEHRIRWADLSVGDRIVVRPGETIAADGVVEHGRSAIDQSLLTGESVPVDVGPGDTVVGGAINGVGRLEIRATGVGSDTAMARIATLVANAQTSKAPIQRVADRVAATFVPGVIAAAALTYLAHRRSARTIADAMRPALSVLVVACPCAMGLATPAALMAGVGRGAELGIFLRSAKTLESSSDIDTILLDKTGTITYGQMRVIESVYADGVDCDLVMAWAGALQNASEHPIGRAIAIAAEERIGRLGQVEKFAALPGFGVAGDVAGNRVIAARPSALVELGHTVPDGILRRTRDFEADGLVAVGISVNEKVCAVFAVADLVRPTSAEAVQQLKNLGLKTVMLTGDHEVAGQRVARDVGVDQVVTGLTPAEKDCFVRRFQASGHKVAMVGDGLNDAPALARSDLGVAIGTGTDVAIAAADITLASNDLRTVADAIALSRATLRTIRANLVWAAGYNALAIPLAARGRLNPIVASVGMSVSTVLVLWNSARLNKFRPKARG